MSIRTTATSGPFAGLHEYGSVEELADVPGSGGVAHRTPFDLPTLPPRLAPALRIPLAIALAFALSALWLIVDPRTPDLANAVYRVGLYRQLGFAVWDEHWYAGHHLPGYSLLLPPLGALMGARLLGVLAVLASTLLFERLLRPLYGQAASWGAAWFALAAVGDIWSGRLAFALGVPFALAAGLALRRRRYLAAVVLAALCAAASPVAAALLGLAALTYAFAQRSPRIALTLALPAAFVVVVLALLFPEGGIEPYPILSFAATAIVVVLFLAALPRDESLLRLGGALYLLACLTCLLVHTPIGSNIERYGVLLAGPLLLCARLSSRAGLGGRSRARSGSRAASGQVLRSGPWAWSGPLSRSGPVSRSRWVLNVDLVSAAALCAIAVWVVWGPVRETLAVAGNQSTSAAYYLPVERFLAANVHTPVRIEVPLTRSHWEAALLAPSVSLARGWEKQLDSRYDHALLTPGLTAGTYARWLRQQAVAYVALPDTPLDPSSAQEGRLIRGGLPYLREVSASAHWRIYRVLAPTPLVSGPGRLSSLGHDSFTLHALSPGRFLVRVRFTRYWTITQGSGCVREAPGGWTSLTLPAAGAATVAARFSLARAFATGGSCSEHAGN